MPLILLIWELVDKALEETRLLATLPKPLILLIWELADKALEETRLLATLSIMSLKSRPVWRGP